MSENFKHCDIVLFEMETAGLGVYDDVIQIAAHGRYNDTSFNTYMIPPHGIHPKTTDYNGFTYDNGYLYQYGNCYDPVPARYGFKDFLNYLNSFDHQVILVAHNAFRFDRIRLIKLAQRVSWFHRFSKLVAGFADTLPIIKNAIHSNSYSLPMLAQDYIHSVDLHTFHDAEYKVRILDQLLDKLNIDEYDIKDCAQPL